MKHKVFSRQIAKITDHFYHKIIWIDRRLAWLTWIGKWKIRLEPGTKQSDTVYYQADAQVE